MANSAVVRRLDLKPTYITDTSDNSNDFFRVSEIPSVFKLGTNIIKINPNPEQLVPGSNVEFEVLDSRLLSLPVKLLPGVDGSGRRTIEIEVVDETPPEEVTITIVGDLRSKFLPPNFPTKQSVKWTRRIIADPLEVTIEGSTSGSLLSGSMFIGDGFDSGIQLRGDNQGAFVRSQGYFGFNNATTTDSTGFLLYSGSILPNSGDGYGGIGLEMVIDQNNFFKYRTSDNSIDIRTNKFFFGSSSQFISGSDGQIEISSSNFHLNKDGEVIMQGTITAQAGGDIGGWHVGTSILSSSNNTVRLDPDGPYYISSSGFQVDGAGGITASAGLIGGWELPTDSDGLFATDANGGVVMDSSQKILRILTGSATTDVIIGIGQIATNKYGIIGKKFGTNNTTFKLGEDGNEIAGITFDDGKLHVGTTYHISASTNAEDATGFISSSQFKVSPSGRMTGSEVLLGNKAGGNFLQFAGSTLTVQGTITADNIRTPAQIGGSPSTEANASASIKSDGFARFVSASIGGWSVDEGTLTDISGAVKLDSQGPYFISSSGFQIDETGAVTASAGNIGGFVIDSDSITSTGIAIRSGDAIELGSATAIGSGQGVFLGNDGTFRAGNPAGQQIKFDGSNITLSSSAFFLGGSGQFVSGSSGNIEISSSGFHLKPAGDVVISGSITANQGSIANWNIIPGLLYGLSQSLITVGLDSTTNGGRIFVKGGTFGMTGIQLDYNNGTPRFHVGQQNGPFMKFDGAEVDISSSGFYLGGGGQFISGSSGNIEISSSGFHLNNAGNISASGVHLSGNITADAGNIGGLSISNSSLSVGTTFQISSSANAEDPVGFISSSNFKVSPDGDITGSSVLLGDKAGGNFLEFAGSTMTVQGTITADNIRTPALIGGNPSTEANASSSIKADGFARFVSGSVGGIKFDTGKLFVPGGAGFNIFHISASTNAEDPVGFISSSNFSISPSGRLTGSNVLFDGGTIGGFTLGTDKISSTGVHISSSYGVKVFTPSAPEENFVEMKYLNDNAYGIRAVSGSDTVFQLGKNNQIAGWNFTNEKIQGGDLILRQEGTIESDGFVSNLAGSGFRLTAEQGGFLEVENARIRGTLATVEFEKETVNAVGGQLYVANSTVLTSSAQHPGAFHSATDTTMSVANVSGFAIGEILSLKKVSPTGFSTEYVKILSASRDDAGSATNFGGIITVTRGYSGSTPQGTGSLGEAAGPAQSYTGSQVVVSTGKVGTGYIRLNANPNDPTTPYMQIVERTGSGIYDVQLRAQVGDLSGITDSRFSDDVTGHGIYTENGYFAGKIEIGSQPSQPPQDRLLLHYNFGQNTGSKILSQTPNGITASFSTLSKADLKKLGAVEITASGTELQGPKSFFANEFTSSAAAGSNAFSAGYRFQLKSANIDKNVFLTRNYPRFVVYKQTNDRINVRIYSSSIDQTNGNISGSTPAQTINFSTSVNDQIEADTLYHVFVTAKENDKAEIYLYNVDSGSLIEHVTASLSGFKFGWPYHSASITGSVAYEEWEHGAPGWAGSNNESFQGSFHDIRYYRNHVLTARETEAIMMNQDSTTGGTIIEGDQITTGKIKSNNYGGGEGSKFDLDDGTFKMGGRDNPKLEFDGTTLTVDGTISASAGNIGGFNIDAHSISHPTVMEINDLSQTLFISSSNFKVSHFGNVTASNVDLSGKITADEGEIGGFTIDAHSIRSDHASGNVEINDTTQALFLSSSNFQVSHLGNITASNIDLSGKISSSVGSIGGFNIAAGQLDGGAGTIKMSAADKEIHLGSGQSIMILSATDGLHLGTASFAQAPFSVNMDGEVIATTGNIGGFTLGSTALNSGNSVKIANTSDASNLFLSSSNFKVSHAGNITASNVAMSGDITATAGTIGGWTVASTLSAGSGTSAILLDPATPRITLGGKTSLSDGNHGVYIGTDGISIGANVSEKAVFSIDVSGSMTSKTGTVGGWQLSDTTLTGGTITLDSSTPQINVALDGTEGGAGLVGSIRMKTGVGSTSSGGLKSPLLQLISGSSDIIWEMTNEIHFTPGAAATGDCGIITGGNSNSDFRPAMIFLNSNVGTTGYQHVRGAISARRYPGDNLHSNYTGSVNGVNGISAIFGEYRHDQAKQDLPTNVSHFGTAPAAIWGHQESIGSDAQGFKHGVRATIDQLASGENDSSTACFYAYNNQISSDGGEGTGTYHFTFYGEGASSGGRGSVMFNEGTIFGAADVVAYSGVSAASDIRLKKNRRKLIDPLATVLKLKGAKFEWKKDDKTDIGFIAQEVETIIPEIVKTNDFDMNTGVKDMKTVEYGKLAPYLVEAIKEQQKQIDELKQQIKKLENK